MVFDGVSRVDPSGPRVAAVNQEIPEGRDLPQKIVQPMSKKIAI